MARYPLAPARARRPRSRLLIGLALVGLALIVSGRLSGPEPGPSPASGAIPPGPLPAADACADQVGRMSLRDRLAQRLMIGLGPGDDAGAVREVVRTTHVGGVFLGGDAVDVLAESVITELRTAGPVPAVIAVDDEGGRVQRVDRIFGDLPSARRMGAMPVDRVRDLARMRGTQLASLGITLDFAPVLDVGDQPAGEVIGDRSFASDPQVVITHAGAWAAGLRESGVTPVFKHFPGHGRARGDSHRTLPTTPPLDALRAVDLVPYEHLLVGAPAAVMVGHLDVPGLTDGTPASLSPATYRLLRDETGFTGVAVTDDLGGMRAVSGRHDVVDAVALALEAGADIALWTSAADVVPVLDALVAKTQAGALPAASTDAAVGRILRLKGLCRA